VTDNTGDYLETEQKYDADADFVLPDLSGLEGRVRPAAPRRYYLSATYFDTEELDLIRNRITLRRRVGGADEGWHLKLPVRKDTRQEVRTPLGEGDAAVVYATDVSPDLRDKLRTIEIPDALNVTAEYAVGLVKTGAESAAARDFYRYLMSAEARAQLAKSGFLPP